MWKDTPKVNKALAKKIRCKEEQALKKSEGWKRHKGKDMATGERSDNDPEKKH